MKAKTKKQLALELEISMSKLQRLLNYVWYDELLAIGYSRTLKLLSPKMLKVIYENWGFEYEN